MVKQSSKREKIRPRRWAKCLEALENRQLLSTWNPVDSNALTNILNQTSNHPTTGQKLAYGDTIVLDTSVTYTGSWKLRNLGSGTGDVTITSSKADKLPSGDVRITPADRDYLAHVQSPGFNGPIFFTESDGSAHSAPGPTHNYKFVGVEFIGPANNSDLVTLVTLGSDGTDQTTEADVAHHFVFDKVYMRPNIPTASVRRAIAMNGAYTDVLNSWIEEIHQPGSDSQALGGWNGLGPFNIINNHLEAGSENIMFGGSTSRIRPTQDVVIRGNHITKPRHWIDHDSDAGDGANYIIKNLFELKHGKNFLVENNIFENTWGGEQFHAIVIKLGDLASSPNNVTDNILIRNNLIRNAPAAVVLQGRDYASGVDNGGRVRNITFENNLFYNMGHGGDSVASPYTGVTEGSTFGALPYNIQITDGPRNVTFNHNTFVNSGTSINSTGSMYVENQGQYPVTGFKFINNIMHGNTYGVRSDLGSGDLTFDNDTDPTNGNGYFGDLAGYVDPNGIVSQGSTFAGNILTGHGPASASTGTYNERPNNRFPGNWTATAFVDRVNHNYRLATNLASPPNPPNTPNPNKNSALDGTDPGANIDNLEAAVKGVATGVFYSDDLNDQFILERIVASTDTPARPRFRLDNTPPWPAAVGDFVDVLGYYQGFYFKGMEGNDSLDVRFTNGSPLPSGNTVLGVPVRGIQFDGGNGTDAVTFSGNIATPNTTAAVYTPSGATTGNGAAVLTSVISGISVSGNVSFAGTESFTNSNLSSFTLTTANANDSITVGAGAVGRYNVGGTSGGIAILSADVNSSAPLILDLAAGDSGAGNDDVTVSSASVPSSVSINAGTGSNTFTANAGVFALNTNLGIGGKNVDLNLNNAGTVVTLTGSQTLDDIVIGSGGKATLVAGAAATLRATSIAITGAGSQLNLADGAMILNYSGSSPLGNGAVYSGVTKLLKDGHNGGAWNGVGIVTSMTAAQSPSLTNTLGVAEASYAVGLGVGQTGTWNGQSVDATALLIKYTWNGDANVSGTVDADDYWAIDSGYSKNGSALGFHNGDFDYSNAINSDDYVAIDAGYSAGMGAAAPAASEPIFSTEAIAPILSHAAPASSPAAVTGLSTAELPTSGSTKKHAEDQSLVDELF